MWNDELTDEEWIVRGFQIKDRLDLFCEHLAAQYALEEAEVA